MLIASCLFHCWAHIISASRVSPCAWEFSHIISASRDYVSLCLRVLPILWPKQTCRCDNHVRHSPGCALQSFDSHPSFLLACYIQAICPKKWMWIDYACSVWSTVFLLADVKYPRAFTIPITDPDWKLIALSSVQSSWWTDYDTTEAN